ncbi:MAG: DUF3226 domain-containing protein [Pseudanabaena sp.]
MLNSFQINNFRLFEKLEVKKLGRVNLIVGKNNCGKSTFLEAIQIYASNATYEVLLDLIYARQETWSNDVNKSQLPNTRYAQKSFLHQVLNFRKNSVRHLFFGHQIPEINEKRLSLGEASKLPTQPKANGTIVVSNDEPKLGFWLMPNNQVSGMLEDFCAELAEPNSLAFARTCVLEAQSRNLTTFKEVHRSKAEIHTYLSWHDEPDNPRGRAITKQALQPHTDLAIKFTDWLIRLFA